MSFFFGSFGGAVYPDFTRMNMDMGLITERGGGRTCLSRQERRWLRLGQVFLRSVIKNSTGSMDVWGWRGCARMLCSCMAILSICAGAFFWERVSSFHQTLKEVCGLQKVKEAGLNYR